MTEQELIFVRVGPPSCGLIFRKIEDHNISMSIACIIHGSLNTLLKTAISTELLLFSDYYKKIHYPEN